MRLLVEVVEARWTATGHGDGSNDTFSAGEGRAGSGNVGGSNDGDDGSGSDEQGGREEGNASGNPARIARASSLAATHTSGTSELVSSACVPDLTYIRGPVSLELEPFVFVQLFLALGLFAFVWLLHLVCMYILRVQEVRFFKNPFLCTHT